MPPLRRFLIGQVTRDVSVATLYVFRDRALYHAIRVPLCSVSIRAAIRRRKALRVRFISRLGRSRVKALRHLFRNYRDVLTIFGPRRNRAGAIVHRTLICFRLVCGDTPRDRVRVFLFLSGPYRRDGLFCGSQRRGGSCSVFSGWDLRECYFCLCVPVSLTGVDAGGRFGALCGECGGNRGEKLKVLCYCSFVAFTGGCGEVARRGSSVIVIVPTSTHVHRTGGE